MKRTLITMIMCAAMFTAVWGRAGRGAGGIAPRVEGE